MTDALVFEEPPPRTQRSEHYALLMALKENPGKGFARVKIDLDEKDANRLAAQVRAAASKLGDGFEVIARWMPTTGKHGVWAKYDEAPGDQPPEDIAAKMNAEAMKVLPPDAVAGYQNAVEHPEQLVRRELRPPEATAADVLQRGVVDEMPVAGAVPEYAGPRTTAYGEPGF